MARIPTVALTSANNATSASMRGLFESRIDFPPQGLPRRPFAEVGRTRLPHRRAVVTFIRLRACERNLSPVREPKTKGRPGRRVAPCHVNLGIGTEPVQGLRV